MKKRKTIKQILLRAGLFCFLLPLLIFWIILFGVSMQALRSNSIVIQRDLTTLLTASVEKELQKMEQDLETIGLESGIQEQMRQIETLPFGSDLKESYIYLDRIFAQIKLIKSSRCQTVCLVTKNGMVYTSDFISAETKKTLVADEWYQSALAQKGKPSLIDIVPDGKGGENLIVGKMILDNEKYSLVGAVFLSYPLSTLNEPLITSSIGQDSLLMLTNKDMMPIYTNVTPSEELLSDLVLNKDELISHKTENIQDQPVLCSLAGDNLQLVIVNIPSISSLYASLLANQSAVILLGAVCILLFCITIFYSYHKFYRPLQEILMTKSEANKPTEIAYDCYELNEINSTISSLIRKNHDGEEEVVRLINKNETITLDKMQAQLNPHFLYNTLTTIKYLAIKNGQTEISGVITALVKFLRSIVNRDGNLVSLKQELETVSNYILIENIAYNGNFQYSCQVDEMLLEYLVPNFILQPLLENSIFHGIHPDKKGGILKITASIKDDELRIYVSDNGDGFESENLLEILSGGASQKNHVTNLGLKSVHQKIKLLCGAKYGLTIFSNSDEGATIQIRLPLNKSKEEFDAESTVSR